MSNPRVFYRCAECKFRTYQESFIRKHVLNCYPASSCYKKVSEELVRVEKEKV